MTSLAPVLTVRELARLLKVSEATVRRMNLKAVRLGKNKWRYVTSMVLDELAKRAE